MKRSLGLVVVLFLIVTAGSATAAPLLTPGTLADYIALVGGGQLDDKLFFDFSYTGTGLGGANAISAGGIMVTPVSTPFNPGLQFSANWSVGPGQELDSLISYKVLVLPGGAPITDISATMTGSASTSTGIVSVDEATNQGNTVSLLDSAATGTIAFDETTFAPKFGPLTVNVDIQVSAGANGTATVSTVTNQLSETAVPEPSTLVTWSLVGALAVAVGWWRRGRPRSPVADREGDL